jgi:hypothetical protein
MCDPETWPHQHHRVSMGARVFRKFDSRVGVDLDSFVCLTRCDRWFLLVGTSLGSLVSEVVLTGAAGEDYTLPGASSTLGCVQPLQSSCTCRMQWAGVMCVISVSRSIRAFPAFVASLIASSLDVSRPCLSTWMGGTCSGKAKLVDAELVAPIGSGGEIRTPRQDGVR